LDIDADICKVARGDHPAFGRVVEAHQHRIFAYLGRMGLDRASAEDIAQETFLRVWRHAGGFNPQVGGLATWILSIARNLALTHLARRARGAEVSGVDDVRETASDEPRPDEQLLAKERRDRFRAALAQLSPGDRSLLAASYVEGLALADIARLESCSSGAVKVRLHRARMRLRQILEKDDG
jgi:RNA polymerase sigma-70 factor, ECF subfamily